MGLPKDLKSRDNHPNLIVPKKDSSLWNTELTHSLLKGVLLFRDKNLRIFQSPISFLTRKFWTRNKICFFWEIKLKNLWKFKGAIVLFPSRMNNSSCLLNILTAKLKLLKNFETFKTLSVHHMLRAASQRACKICLELAVTDQDSSLFQLLAEQDSSPLLLYKIFWLLMKHKTRNFKQCNKSFKHQKSSWQW